MGHLSTAAFQVSPAAVVVEQGRHVRQRLAGPETALDYPISRDLAAAGGTDYAAWALTFSQGQRTIFSIATRAAGGFTDEALALVEGALPAIAARMELAAVYAARRTLLEVYLGPNAAHRVLAGEFRRGSGTAIHAAVWTCDLRGFTELSDRVAAADVTAVLDGYFERVVGPIRRHGGEVLKFIGDAVLAIFPVEAAGAGDPCRRALAAAKEALAAMDAWNAGQPMSLEVGVALHLGEVFYGNIGGPDRLDFTVIGAVVNEACRLEPLCKTLGARVVMSAAFVEQLGPDPVGAIADLGAHPLRGVGAPMRVFGLRG